MPLFLDVRQSATNPAAVSGRNSLDAGQLVIGRGDDADLRLANPFVSRRHAIIHGAGGQWQISDASSSGTTINGQRIAQAQVLRHGDVIGIGDIAIGVRIEQGAVAAPAPAAAPSAALNLDTWGRPAAAQAAPVAAAASGAGAMDVLLHAAGISRSTIALDDRALAQALGMVVRAALAGLSTLAQDRARARTDLKVPPAGTAAGNPVLEGGAPDAILARLLALPGNGPADAVMAASRSLDAHQRAALGAWQATFAATLDHFAPEAIRARANGDAAAWAAYQRAFAGRDGFVETFAQEFAKAYCAAAG